LTSVSLGCVPAASGCSRAPVLPNANVIAIPRFSLAARSFASIDREGVPSMQSTIELRRRLDARLARPHDREVFGLDVGDPAKRKRHPAVSKPSTRSDTPVKDAGRRLAPRSGEERP
jgi:hypothetical protein